MALFGNFVALLIFDDVLMLEFRESFYLGFELSSLPWVGNVTFLYSEQASIPVVESQEHGSVGAVSKFPNPDPFCVIDDVTSWRRIRERLAKG